MRQTPVRAREKRAMVFGFLFLSFLGEFFFVQVLDLLFHSSLFLFDSSSSISSPPPAQPPSQGFAMASALAGRLSGLSVSSRVS